jgi:seryl-tRNA synthetase
MLDLKFIRENTDFVRRAVALRQDKAPIDEIICLDSSKRQKLTEVEELRRQRKEIARQQGAESADKGRELRDRIKNIEDELRDIDCRLEDLLLRVPNIPQDSVPMRKSEDDNVVIKTCGEPRKFDFDPAPHWEIGEKLGIIDFERGVRLSVPVFMY